jgi:hypothetical protein
VGEPRVAIEVPPVEYEEVARGVDGYSGSVEAETLFGIPATVHTLDGSGLVERVMTFIPAKDDPT